MLDYASKPFQCTTIPIDRLESKKNSAGWIRPLYAFHLDECAIQNGSSFGLTSQAVRDEATAATLLPILIPSPTKKPLVTQSYLRSSARRRFVGERCSWEHMAGPQRGYPGLYLARVNQAGEGCDFDFLREDGGI
jgi:hypothetical protein